MFVSSGKGLLIASLILTLQGAFFAFLGGFFARSTAETFYWQKFGIPAQGEVIMIEDSNMQVNGLSPGGEVLIRYNSQDPSEFTLR